MGSALCWQSWGAVGPTFCVPLRGATGQSSESVHAGGAQSRHRPLCHLCARITGGEGEHHVKEKVPGGIL